MRDCYARNRFCKNCNVNGHSTEYCKRGKTDNVSFVKEKNPVDTIFHKGFTSKATINGQEVNCLRDTGSTITLVRGDMIKNYELTKETTVCTTAFGTRHTIPLIWANVNSTYGAGKMKVGLVKDLAVECILGNDIDNVRKSNREKKCAAITKSKKISEEEERKALPEYDMAESRRGFQLALESVPEEEEMQSIRESEIQKNVEEQELFKFEGLQGISAEKFIKQQQEDKTLTRIRASIGSVISKSTKNKENATHYFMDRGMIFRKYYPVKLGSLGSKSSIKQLVIPAKFRRAILSISHDAPFSSHVGIAKCQANLLQRFY